MKKIFFTLFLVFLLSTAFGADEWSVYLGTSNGDLDTSLVSVDNTNTEFQTITYYFEHDDDTEFLIFTEDNSDNNSGVYLDNLSVIEVPSLALQGPSTYVATTGTTEAIPGQAIYENFMVQSLPVSGYVQLLDYSEDFSEWASTNVTVVADVDGPDGESNSAYTFTNDTTNLYNRMAYTVGQLTADAQYTLSAFVSQGTSDEFTLAIHNGTDGTNDCYIDFEWTNGVPTVKAENGGSGSIDPVSYLNGFYRVSATVDSNVIDGGDTYVARIFPTLLGADGNGDTTIYFGATLTQTSYPLPYVPSNGSQVAVAGPTTSFDITADASDRVNMLRDALSDSDGEDTDGESIFSMVVRVVPKCDFSDVENSSTIVAAQNSNSNLLYIDHGTDDFRSYDGTNSAFANSGDTDPLKDVEQWVLLTCDSTADGGSGEMTLYTSDDQGATWAAGTTVAYDGALALGNTMYFGYNNEYPFLIGPVIFYDEVITTDEATVALSSNTKGVILLN